MERAAGDAGRSINMRDVIKDTRKSSLTYKKPGSRISNIEADTRPNAAIAATKAALQETATAHPQLSVPLEKWGMKTKPTGTTAQGFDVDWDLGANAELRAPRPTVTPGESVLEGVEFNPTVRRGSIPDPMAAPDIVGDVRRGVNAKLVDAYGMDPETKAGIVVDKGWTHAAGKQLEDVTKGIGKRGYADIGKESHDILNLVDAIRQRSYNTATNPVRLYEFLGAISGNIPAVGLGLASRPSNLWRTGRGARMHGEAIQAINPALVRAALLARLGPTGVTMPDQFITSGEFSRWREEETEHRHSLNGRLDEIISLVRLQNGRVFTQERAIGIIERRLMAIESEDKTIEDTVLSIQKDGCHQYKSHEQTLAALEGAGALPNSDGPVRHGFSLHTLTPKQKVAAGAGATALVIPALADLVRFGMSAVAWAHQVVEKLP